MTVNLSSVSVPGVNVQIIPPSPLLNGVPTNIIGVVGSASYGPVNSPTTVGTVQQLINTFGTPVNRMYDLGTQVYVGMQQGANNFVCVRVTDGTDTASSVALLDQSSMMGATLTSIYTGSTGNTLVASISAGSGSTTAAATYKLTIALTGGLPEIFDNIGGTGTAFWTNLVNAVNLGQNQLRGPSRLCVASSGSTISSVTVTNAGSYATLPTLNIAGPGTGQTLNATMKAVSATVVVDGDSYAVGDTITLTGGTHTINTVLTVLTTQLNSLTTDAGGANYLVGDVITLAGGTASTKATVVVTSVSGGAVTGIDIVNKGSYTVEVSAFTQFATTGVGTGATFNLAEYGVKTASVTTPGAYTALPSSPVAQGSSSGSGTNATFTVLWGLLSVQVISGGSGFTSSSALAVTGGGGTGGATGTLNLGSAYTPELDTYAFAGGTDGADNVNSITLVGDDVEPRTGMYALRNSNIAIGFLADATDGSQWGSQASFGLEEKVYMIGVVAAGYQDDPAGAVTFLQNTGVTNYEFKLLTGDWIYFNDPFNGVVRLVSPQGYVAGVLAVTPPSGSSLNKAMNPNSIVATQKTNENRVYSEADLQILLTGGIDVITRPIPLNKVSFGVRLGVNTSGNVITKFDNYPRMINYLARTFETGMGLFIGLPQTPDVQREAKATLDTFLANLVQIGWIGTLDGSPAFSVILDSTNNPTTQVNLGYMQADVQVVLFSIVQNLVINLQAGGNVAITVAPPQLIVA